MGDAPGASGPNPLTSGDEQKKFRARFNVISQELDRLGLDADERSRSVDAKASFLAVASGVVFGGQVQTDFVVPWYVSSLPLLLVTVALACAGVAFLPRKRQGNSPQMVWLSYFDSGMSAASVAKQISMERVRTETAREAALAKRAAVITAGFTALFTSMLLFVVLFAVTSAIE